MTSKFEKLIEDIAKNTGFKRMDMIPYFREYIKNHPVPLKRVKRAYKISRTKSSSKFTKSNVAAYLVKKGSDMIIDWLNYMFNFRRTDLKVETRGGGTSMDAIFLIQYIYNKKELDDMHRIIKENELDKNDINIEDISLLLLSESILCIETVFNEIIGYNFSMMIQNDNIKKYDDKIIVNIEVVTRLYA
ncbi:MAG: hypothetical protein ACTSRP_15370 [Candidatus Helarchaeota archaeon]